MWGGGLRLWVVVRPTFLHIYDFISPGLVGEAISAVLASPYFVLW